MALVNAALVKKHLRIPDDQTDFDEEISAYHAAAESIVTEYLDREVLPEGSPLPDPGDSGYDPYTMLITPAVTAAVLLLIGDLFENREADPTLEGDAVLPRAVRALLAPWRVWRSLEET